MAVHEFLQDFKGLLGQYDAIVKKHFGNPPNFSSVDMAEAFDDFEFMTALAAMNGWTSNMSDAYDEWFINQMDQAELG